MDKKQGLQTRRIGEALEKSLSAFEGVEVFYDHGTASSSQGVCQPTTYMGRRYGRDAMLSGLDIVVTFNPTGIPRLRRVIVIVEIEEHAVRPKTVLGDVFGVALSDNLRIKDHPHPMPIRGVVLIIGVVVEETGKKRIQMLRLERLMKNYFGKKSRGSNISKIRIIPSSYSDLMRRIERLIRLEVSKRI